MTRWSSATRTRSAQVSELPVSDSPVDHTQSDPSAVEDVLLAGPRRATNSFTGSFLYRSVLPCSSSEWVQAPAQTEQKPQIVVPVCF